MSTQASFTKKHLAQGSALLAGLLVAAATYAQPVPAVQAENQQPAPCMNAPCAPELLNGQPAPCGGPRGTPGWRGPGAFHAYMVQALQLTQEQQTQLTTLSQTVMEQIVPLKEQLRQVRTQFSTELRQVEPNKEMLAQLQSQQTELESQITMLRTNARIQAAGILTPEQRTAWTQQIQERNAVSPRNRHPHGRPGHHGRYQPRPQAAPNAQAPVPDGSPTPDANAAPHFGWLLRP